MKCISLYAIRTHLATAHVHKSTGGGHKNTTKSMSLLRGVGLSFYVQHIAHGLAFPAFSNKKLFNCLSSNKNSTHHPSSVI